jgi:CheY-like chemotaxis protein
MNRTMFISNVVAKKWKKFSRLNDSGDLMPVHNSEANPTHRVLVVDDNEGAAKVLALLLSRSGYDTREAHNGKQAIQIAKDFRPEIVLLDLGMPIFDGFDVARQFLGTPGLDKVILIAVTGRGGDEWVERTREAGFHYHLLKTVGPETILRFLEALPAMQEQGGAL